jgi:hypothetical protein
VNPLREKAPHTNRPVQVAPALTTCLREVGVSYANLSQPSSHRSHKQVQLLGERLELLLGRSS